MWTKRLLVAAAAVAVLSPAGLALAQSSTAGHEMEAQNEAAEVKLAVPRTATGAIDVQALLAEIAALLPKDGVERKVTLRGAVDVRVTRQPDGTLRARIEDVNLGNLTAEQRAQLAQQLAALGFTRVEIRGVDAAGKRVRVEFRADRGIKRDDDGARDSRRVADASGRHDRRVVVDRPDRAERPDRPEKAERAERAEHVDRPERSGRH